MCFSASASFIAGATLTVIGVASIKKTKKPSQIPFASIPFLFALQQITEGFVWLSLTNTDYAFLENFSTHAFIFFAQVIWPIWIPLSFLKFKEKRESKVLGKTLVGLGIVLSSVLAFFLFTNHVEAEILGNHIAYSRHYPENLHLIGVILYVIVTIVPPFTSSNRRMWLLGSVLTLSFVVAKIFYAEYLLSVWCFFAAVISAMILWIVVDEGKK